MKRNIHTISFLTKPAALFLLSIWATSPACKCAKQQISGSGGVPAPTIDNLPARTVNPALEASGQRGAQTKVWLHFDHEEDARLAADITGDAAWLAPLGLREGINTFVAIASDNAEQTFSARVGPVRVELDTTAPAPPVVDAFASPQYLAGAGAADVTFTGTKDADGNLLVDGSEEVEHDAQTSWSFTVNLAAGSHTFSLSSADDLGNTSAAVEMTMVLNDIVPPTLDAVTTPTTLTPQSISGSKGAGTSVHLVFDHDQDTEYPLWPEDSATTWSHDLDLVEGNNTLRIFARQASLPGEMSAAVMATILLDTTPPVAPSVDAVTSPTTDDTVSLTGSRAADGNLCLRQDQAGACTEVLPRDGDTSFSGFPATTLHDGENILCLSSIDAVGNQSEETCVTIVKLVAPSVTVAAPAAGPVGSTVEVTVDAVGGPGLLAVARVQVCIEDDTGTLVAGSCADATEGNPDRFHATLDFSGLTIDGSYTIVATATNSGGVSGDDRVGVTYNAGGALLVTDNQTPGHAREVVAAWDATNSILHVVWSDECVDFGFGSTGTECRESKDGNLPWDIFHRSLSGTTWSDILLISDDDNDGNSGEPAIAVASDGKLHLVWVEEGNVAGSGGDRDIVHRTYDPSEAVGSRLAAIAVVTAGATDDFAPAIAGASDGKVHLTWVNFVTSSDRDIMYARWNGTWETAKEISQVTDCAGPGSEDLCEIRAACEWDDGATTCQNANGDALAPDIAVTINGLEAHVVWQEERADGLDVYYRLVEDGDPDAEILEVSANAAYAGDSRSPAAVVDSTGTLHVVWKDDWELADLGSSDEDIYYRQYSSAGAAGQIKLVSEASGEDSDTPHVALHTGNTVYVSWAETDPVDSANTDMRYRMVDGSTADGALRENAVSPANNLALSVRPAAAIAGNTMHLVWEDDSNMGTNDTLRPAGAKCGGSSEACEDTDILYLSISLD